MSFFSRVQPASNESAVIVEVPHSGCVVPDEFAKSLIASRRAIFRDGDPYVDALFSDAPSEGATLLVAHASRCIVDLNRSPADIDSGVVQGAPHRTPPRSYGLIWRHTTDRQPTLERPLSRGEFERRMREIYLPYHRALAEEVEAKKARFGHTVLIAAHSMPSYDRPIVAPQAAIRSFPKRREDIVLGTLDGASSGADWVALVEEVFIKNGLKVAHNEPFRGGFTTQKYGNPAAGVHAIQIEISRRLYMDEENSQPVDRAFAIVRRVCQDVVARLAARVV